jgi:hypothetical protein
MGQHWISDGQAAGGLSLFRTNITRALESGKKWKVLESNTDNMPFLRELKRHGIEELDWNFTVEHWKKGTIKNKDDQLFDIMMLKSKADQLGDPQFANLGNSTYLKWHKYFASNVDGFARMRPGDTERVRLSFYNTEDGVMNGLLKNMTQFKSFSFAVGRRLNGREMQEGGTIGLMKAVATVTIFTSLGALAYAQAVEVMNGRKPFRLDSSILYERALTRTPILGALAVIPPIEMIAQNLI